MNPALRNPDRIVAALGKLTLGLFVLYGLLITLFPVLPFWLDEWLLLDNLKFKTAAQLWGPLDRTQQFPRVYLELVKTLSDAFDYQYTSLRLPAFLAHCFGLTMLWHLAPRIIPSSKTSRWLWIMIYVSFNTSIHYFAQLKQYTMEMALSLLAIWQLLELFRPRPRSGKGTALLTASMLMAPFFSYTYPIVLAPVYLIIALRALRDRRLPAASLLPLGAGICAIATMYWIDTRHVLADPGMQDFWQDLLMKSFDTGRFFRNTWMMFCTLGSGDLFAAIFGALGLAGFIRASYLLVRRPLAALERPVMLYAVLLVWVVILLFVAGKLPLGTFRLNSFLVPALGYLIVSLLQAMASLPRLRVPAQIFTIALFLASVGNVFATMAELAGEEHRRKLAVYRASEDALRAASREHLPVLVSSAIAYPFEDRWPGDWILKVQPAFHVRDSVTVFQAPMSATQPQLQAEQPQLHGRAIYLDGPTWRRIDL